MVGRAPNPISRSEEYFNWLKQVCTVYNRLIPDVKPLLMFTYGAEWMLSKETFGFPESEASGQWPASKTLKAWLEGDAKTAIAKCSVKRSDLLQIAQCSQGSEEPLPEFVQWFITTWDSNAGIK